MLKKIISLAKSKKELISYVFFGGMTTLVNYVAYFAFTRIMGINAILSNIAAWFLSVLFAYITNKIWVFNSKNTGLAGLAREISMFFAARVFSGFLDTALLFVLFDCLGINDIFVKIFNGVLVVVLNYFFSKFFIFKKNNSSN